MIFGSFGGWVSVWCIIDLNLWLDLHSSIALTVVLIIFVYVLCHISYLRCDGGHYPGNIIIFITYFIFSWFYFMIFTIDVCNSSACPNKLISWLDFHSSIEKIRFLLAACLNFVVDLPIYFWFNSTFPWCVNVLYLILWRSGKTRSFGC